MNKKLTATTPFERFRKIANRKIQIFSDRFTKDQKFWIGFGFLCLFTSLLVANPISSIFGENSYKEGDIAHETIIAPADIYATDEAQTFVAKENAAAMVKPIFFLESNRGEEAVQGFRAALENASKKNANTSKPSDTNIKTDTTERFEIEKILLSKSFSSNEIDAISRILRESASGYIYAEQDKSSLQHAITLVDRQKPTIQNELQMAESSMVSLSAARAKLASSLKTINSLSEKEANELNNALSTFIQPSVTYDAVATENARKSLSDSVAPITVNLKRGQIVVREGDTVTPELLSKINVIKGYSQSNRRVNRFIGLVVLISALYWAAWKFIQQRGIVPRITLSERRLFGLFGVIALVETALFAVFFRLAEFTAAQNVQAPMNDPRLWSLVIPFGFGSLLIALLADRRTALFAGYFISLIAGLIAPHGLEFALYSAIASSVAVYGIGVYRSRQTVTIAGTLVGVAAAIAALALLAFSQQPFVLNSVLLSIACALASGIATAAFTAVLLPVCETAFGILTDVKLLELSNADLPVLGQLALRAPGTNQHSHAVGQLAEEACRAVGGNGLLARIGALYHDIGKMAAPEHFVENQQGKNPHDKLKPAQSAKIIISHVTYGIKLAKEMGLPQRIIDFIPQHHGTRTLHYFLRKAQSDLRDDEIIEESEFRYPGPKPQFKEAAIMMIADSCEAAARSLEEQTPENIRFIVTKIIDAILSDDQLDECDLTLRELSQIRECIIKSLVSIYHSRVDYPGYTPPPSLQRILIPDEMMNEKPGFLKYKDPAEIPISRGGEIEDEAVDRTNPPEKAKTRSNGN